MQSNQHRENMARPWSSAKMLNDRCSGFFFNDMGRAALLVYRLTYNDEVAAGQLAVFQGASDEHI